MSLLLTSCEPVEPVEPVLVDITALARTKTLSVGKELVKDVKSLILLDLGHF
jgi:hypothetical protein